MLARIPIAASLREFEHAIIEGLLEDNEDVRERKIFPVHRLEFQIVFEPLVDPPARPLLVADIDSK